MKQNLRHERIENLKTVIEKSFSLQMEPVVETEKSLKMFKFW